MIMIIIIICHKAIYTLRIKTIDNFWLDKAKAARCKVKQQRNRSVDDDGGGGGIGKTLIVFSEVFINDVLVHLVEAR